MFGWSLRIKEVKKNRLNKEGGNIMRCLRECALYAIICFMSLVLGCGVASANTENDAAVGTASIRIVSSGSGTEPQISSNPVIVQSSRPIKSSSILPDTSAIPDWEIVLFMLLLIKILIVVAIILERKKVHHAN